MDKKKLVSQGGPVQQPAKGAKTNVIFVPKNQIQMVPQQRKQVADQLSRGEVGV